MILFKQEFYSLDTIKLSHFKSIIYKIEKKDKNHFLNDLWNKIICILRSVI